jgi:hypothetical protein
MTRITVPCGPGHQFSRPEFRPEFRLTSEPDLLVFARCRTGSAYPEWLRGQARGRHSNLALVPRC